MEQHLHVNGSIRTVSGDPDRKLLWVLREELGLTGTKYGCGEAQCGACVVLVGGRPVPACDTAVGSIGDAEITTIEGIESNGALHPVQEAFIAADALQCGYCTPGMVVAVVALKERNPHPSEADAIDALNKHVCRCGTYRRILNAISSDSHREDTPAQMASANGLGSPAAASYPVDFEVRSESHPSLGADKIAGRLFDNYGDGIAVLTERITDEPVPPDFDVWLHVAASGSVTLCTGKAEVGQNIRTSLAQAVSEVMVMPADRVNIVLGDTALTPFDMGTYGSMTTPFTSPQVRRAAAAAILTLKQIASERWSVSCDSLTVRDGTVSDDSRGRALAYAELAAGLRMSRIVRRANIDAPYVPRATQARPTAKSTAAEFVTGRHRYSSDQWRGGMLIGKVVRPPAYGAKLESIDFSAAESQPGVIVMRDGDFAGIAAPSRAAAIVALDSVKAKWVMPDAQAGKDLISLLRPVTAGLDPVEPGAGTLTLDATYTTAYIAHVPLEPRAALAEWDGDHKLTVWTGSQRPFGIREALSVEFGLPEESVRVIVPDTGSGYGGKHTPDAALEAARLSRAAGSPVKVVWTREEEFAHSYLRPASVIDISASIRKDGILSNWRCDNYNSGSPGLASPYHIPRQTSEFHESDSPLRQGAYRALAATANNFARECHMDDLANSAGIDPLEFRLRNLTNDRLSAVLSAAADRFGWSGRVRREGIGFGLACGTDKGSYIANFVELAVDPDGEVKLERIVVAFECGSIVNPLHLENQVEGATVQGIGGALFETIKFDGGRVLNGRLSEYRVPRFSDVPPIEIVLLDRKNLASAGAGESPIIAIAPAIRNAIADATGLRLRSLPLELKEYRHDGYRSAESPQ